MNMHDDTWKRNDNDQTQCYSNNIESNMMRIIIINIICICVCVTATDVVVSSARAYVWVELIATE